MSFNTQRTALISKKSITYDCFLDHDGKPALSACWPSSVPSQSAYYPCFQIYAAVDGPFLSQPNGVQQAKYWCHSIINSLATSKFYQTYKGVRLEVYDSINLRQSPAYSSDNSRIQAFARHAIAEREHRSAMISLAVAMTQQKSLTCKLKEMHSTSPGLKSMLGLHKTKWEEISQLIHAVDGEIREVKGNDNILSMKNMMSTPPNSRHSSMSSVTSEERLTSLMATSNSSQKRERSTCELEVDTNKKARTDSYLKMDEEMKLPPTSYSTTVRHPLTPSDNRKGEHRNACTTETKHLDPAFSASIYDTENVLKDDASLRNISPPRLTAQIKPVGKMFRTTFKHIQSISDQYLAPFFPLSFHCPRTHPYHMAIICITQPWLMTSGVHVACFKRQQEDDDRHYSPLEAGDQECLLTRVSLRPDGAIKTKRGEKPSAIEKRKTLAFVLQGLMKNVKFALLNTDAELLGLAESSNSRRWKPEHDIDEVISNDWQVDNQAQEEFDSILEATKQAENHWTHLY